MIEILLASFRNNADTTDIQAANPAAVRQGRKYGYSFQNGVSNILGSSRAGWLSVPPRNGPKVEPVDQTRGRNAKPGPRGGRMS
jgi:hypothetical protein